MPRIENEIKELAMAVSRLEEAVIHITSSIPDNNDDLEHYYAFVLDATLNGADKVSELLSYIQIRLASKSWLVQWRTLWLVHFLIINGDTLLVMQCLLKEKNILERFGPSQFTVQNIEGNVWCYRDYLLARIAVYETLNFDLPTTNECDPAMFNRLLDSYFLLIQPFCKLKFYIDDFEYAIMVQTIQLIADDYIFLFRKITELLVVKMTTADDNEGASIQMSIELLEQYLSIESSFISFLDLMKRLEPALDKNIPKIASIISSTKIKEIIKRIQL